MQCVYKITNLINGKFYIGSTNRFKKRRQQWRDFSSNTDSAVKKDILKYGRDNFIMEPIAVFPSGIGIEELHAKELEYIHRLNPEYNTIGKPRPASTRLKLAKAQKGKKMPDWIGRKISESQRKRHELIPQTNAGHLKDVLIVETGETIHGVKNAAKRLGASASTVTHAIKRRGTVKGFHVCLTSVETMGDECSPVGEKMSYSSKCTASEKMKR